MRKSLKIFFAGCGIVIFIVAALLGFISYRLYQDGKPEAKFFRVFNSHPSDCISELKIEESSSFIDDHSIFKFKCKPENFKKLKLLRWGKESGSNSLGKKDEEKLIGKVKEFNLKISKEIEYEFFSSNKNPMLVYLGYDKENELVFGWAISFWDKVPEDNSANNRKK